MIGFYAQAFVPFILVNPLKKVKSPLNRPGAGLIGLSLTAAMVGVVYGQALPPLLAKAPEPAGEAASQDVAAVEGSVSASEEASRKSEETLLTHALKELKANNLSQAIDSLAHLKDQFPDNDDYLLLYRTALRKKNSSDADSQKWYNYERNLEKKEEDKHTSLSQAQEHLTVPAAKRINDLKRATWVVLTTGKHKSANAGRREHHNASQNGQ